MKTIKLSLLLTFSLLFSFTQAQNWQLVWADEFTTEIGPEWGYDTGGDGWGNNELQYYRQENASIENGNLVITAKKEDFGGRNYTSSRLKTQGNISWKYGKIEARIQLPAIQGTWPAFWMIGDKINSVGWPACGEIDILEQVNTENSILGTIHWDNNGYVYYGGNTTTNVSSYHIYAIEWDESVIKWTLDGVAYHEANIANGINGTSEFHENFFVILNMAVGGNLAGWDIDDSSFPAKMYVDYVRVYENTTPTSSAPVGSKIFLKGSNGKYVNSQNGYSGMTCNSRKAGTQEYFTIVDAGNAKIALQGSNGQYVSSENGLSAMMCNRSGISDWETFTWVDLGNGNIALQGSNGLFVSSENGTTAMNCSRTAIDAWETFTWGTSRKAAEIALSVENMESALNIYPNPVIDHLTIETENENYTLEIFDMQGKNIYQSTLLNGTATLNLRDIQSGLYLLKINSNKGIEVQQIVIK